MPFTDKAHILKENAFKADLEKEHIDILMGDTPQSVLILRSIAKFCVFLGAGVVIATSIVLKDIPLICINLLLASLVLFYQVYQLIMNEEERLRFLIELLIILVAAGIAIWLVYPVLVTASLNYLTVLIFANYIATVINVAAVVSNMLAPFIFPWMSRLLIWIGLMQKPSRSQFELNEKNEFAVNNIISEYYGNAGFGNGYKKKLNKY